VTPLIHRAACSELFLFHKSHPQSFSYVSPPVMSPPPPFCSLLMSFLQTPVDPVRSIFDALSLFPLGCHPLFRIRELLRPADRYVPFLPFFPSLRHFSRPTPPIAPPPPPNFCQSILFQILNFLRFQIRICTPPQCNFARIFVLFFFLYSN